MNIFLPVYKRTATARTSSRWDESIELAIDVKAAIALDITAMRSEGWLSVGTFQSRSNTQKKALNSRVLLAREGDMACLRI